MSVVKRIVCLANSRKVQGRCVAGIEIVNRKLTSWIRPISAREHHEVSNRERCYEDGSDPKLLDIIDVPLLCHRPTAFQVENWLLDSNAYWTRVATAPWERLLSYLPEPAAIWVNGDHTYHGRNDRVSIDAARSLRSSLVLLHVQQLRLSVFAPNEVFGSNNRRVLGQFTHKNAVYRLWVTDPAIEREYLQRADGDYTIGESLVTVSLGEEYKGAYYKLIAAIMPRPTR